MSALFITALKGLQLVPNGVGGCFMVTDMLHGKVRDDFTRKLGYPVWFPTSLGAFKLTQSALNWVAAGAYVPLAQMLVAFQMGGAIYTHSMVEEDNSKNTPCWVFLAVSTLIQVLHGAMGVVAAIGSSALLMLLGFYSGYAISALGDRRRVPQLPPSPMKKWMK